MPDLPRSPDSADAPSVAGAPVRRRRTAPWIALGVAVVLAALFVVLAGADRSGGDSTASSYLIGRPAPVVRSTTLDDQPFDLSRRKGSWVVLNFFDSDCVPCRQEHPELVRFAEQQREPGAIGAELYTVVNDDSDANVRAWFAEHGGDWPIVRDDDGSIFVSFGMAQIPETWIIDPTGIVQARIPRDTTAAEITAVIDRYLGVPPA